MGRQEHMAISWVFLTSSSVISDLHLKHVVFPFLSFLLLLSFFEINKWLVTCFTEIYAKELVFSLL